MSHTWLPVPVGGSYSGGAASVRAWRPPRRRREPRPAPNDRFSRFPRRLTGSSVPDLIVSMSSQMWLHLQSDDSIASPGFKAVYQGRDAATPSAWGQRRRALGPSITGECQRCRNAGTRVATALNDDASWLFAKEVG